MTSSGLKDNFKEKYDGFSRKRMGRFNAKKDGKIACDESTTGDSNFISPN